MSDQSSDNLALEKSSAKIFHRKDLWLASIIIAFGAFMYYEATKFPSAPLVLGDTLNADVFPRILVVMLIILACILPIEFKILGIKPDIWTNEVVISRHQGLLGNIDQELNIGRAVSLIGEEMVKELMWFHPKEPSLKLDDNLNYNDLKIENPYNTYKN